MIGSDNQQSSANQETGQHSIQVYSKIKTLQTDDDKLSLLAIQAAVRASLGKFHYLEIGTYLGGSLQPLLVDNACQTIYAIDSWPKIERDQRGDHPTNQTISYPAMLQEVERFYAPYLHKLICLIGT